jgi:hypothetical protein
VGLQKRKNHQLTYKKTDNKKAGLRMRQMHRNTGLKTASLLLISNPL